MCPCYVSHAEFRSLLISLIRICSDMIVGHILERMYPIRSQSRSRLKKNLPDLERSMDQWFYNLPEDLRYDSASKRVPPPPHILNLHVQYNSARLLLYSPL